MVHIIRRFQQPLMIAVTVLVIVAFAVLYNQNTVSDNGTGAPVAMAYGKGISLAEFRRVATRYVVAEQLRASELTQTLLGREIAMGVMFGQVPRDYAAQMFGMADYILRHEAALLDIVPSKDEIVTAVEEMEIFRTNGSFDMAKFTEFKKNVLGPNGLSEDAISEVASDQVRLKKLKELVGSPGLPTPAEVREAYTQRYQKADTSVIRLKLEDFEAAVQISEDDLKKAFDERKDTLKTDELRKVKYVSFAVPKAEENEGGTKNRMEEMTKVAEKASDFYVAVTDGHQTFEDAAAKAGLTVQVTPEFTAAEAPEGLGKQASAATAAFKLTKLNPISDVLAVGDTYSVLLLDGVTESRPLTFDESKEKLTTTLKDERAKETMDLKASELRNKIEAEVLGGKSFADAVKDAGVTAESIPPFALSDRNKLTVPNAEDIMRASADVPEKRFSEFNDTGTGGFLLFVNKREPIDEADFEKQKKSMTESVSRQKEYMLFAEWMKERSKDANFQFASRDKK